jgi:hypothetical protein
MVNLATSMHAALILLFSLELKMLVQVLSYVTDCMQDGCAKSV